MLRSALSAAARPTYSQFTKRGGIYTVRYLSPFSRRRHLCITRQVTLIPGDGIGQEITQSVKDIFKHVNAPIAWEQYDVSGVSSSGEALFLEAMESLKRNRVGLKGIYR